MKSTVKPESAVLRYLIVIYSQVQTRRYHQSFPPVESVASNAGDKPHMFHDCNSDT